MKQLEDSAMTLQRVLKAMTFRQLLMLLLIAGIYLIFILGRGLTPAAVEEAFRPVKFLGFVQDCPVLSLTLNGQSVPVIYRAFRGHSRDNPASYVIAAYTHDNDWTNKTKGQICEDIGKYVAKLYGG